MVNDAVRRQARTRRRVSLENERGGSPTILYASHHQLTNEKLHLPPTLSPDIFVVCLVSQSSSMVFFSSGFLPGSFTFFHARHHRLLLLLVSTSCFSLAIRAGQQESGKPRKFLFFCLLVQNARAFFFFFFLSPLHKQQYTDAQISSFP